MRDYQPAPLPIKGFVQAQMALIHPGVRKNLAEWVTNGLAGIKPWVRTLPDRLARTWKKNPNRSTYAHAKERGRREAQLERDLARLKARSYFVRCLALPDRYKASYRAVIGEVHRLLNAGDWHAPREYVNRRTGELIITVYLPEDTWSAQTALAWCVALLDRLERAVNPRAQTPGANGGVTQAAASVVGARTTERATAPYSRGETETGPEDRSRPHKDRTLEAQLERMTKTYFSEQLNLPKTG